MSELTDREWGDAQLRALLLAGRALAEMHQQDHDECGEVAQTYLALLQCRYPDSMKQE